MEKKVITHVTKGLIISLILIVLDLVAGFGNFKTATWFRYIPTIVMLAALIWACVSYGAQNNNTVSFGNLFAHGFKTTAVISCIFVIYTVLSIAFIFPETKEMALEEARKQMEQKGNIPEDAIESGLAITRKFFWPFAIAGSLFGTILFGALASLIGAAVTKKKPADPFDPISTTNDNNPQSSK